MIQKDLKKVPSSRDKPKRATYVEGCRTVKPERIEGADEASAVSDPRTVNPDKRVFIPDGDGWISDVVTAALVVRTGALDRDDPLLFRLGIEPLSCCGETIDC